MARRHLLFTIKLKGSWKFLAESYNEGETWEEDQDHHHCSFLYNFVCYKESKVLKLSVIPYITCLVVISLFLHALHFAILSGLTLLTALAQMVTWQDRKRMCQYKMYFHFNMDTLSWILQVSIQDERYFVSARWEGKQILSKVKTIIKSKASTISGKWHRHSNFKANHIFFSYLTAILFYARQKHLLSMSV